MKASNIVSTERMPGLIGNVVRTLRIARGISVNQLGVAADLEPANLSRFERGVPGGVHASKHLNLIAKSLGTRASVLYAISEMAMDDPVLLKQPTTVSAIANELTQVIDDYCAINSKLIVNE